MGVQMKKFNVGDEVYFHECNLTEEQKANHTKALELLKAAVANAASAERT